MWISSKTCLTLYKICAFLVRMCFPDEAHPHSRGGTSSFLVRHIPIPGEDVHSMVIHPHRGWGCASLGMGMCLTGNGNVPHWEWGCASPGMNILTGNEDVPHRECISSGNGDVPHWEWGCASPGMGMCLTGNENVPRE